MKKIVSVRCCGSCGELFQGVYNEQEILLTYQVEWLSAITLYEKEVDTIVTKQFEKIERIQKEYNIPEHLFLDRKSTIPIEKGCSSSTADVVAAIQACAVYQNKHYTAEELTQLSAKIEPTDSVAFAKWTVINPLTGQVLQQIEWQPDLWVYCLEPKTTLATQTLKRMSDDETYNQKAFAKVYHLFLEAVAKQDVQLLGQVGIQSALLNNDRLEKPFLHDIIKFVEREQLIGLNVAHSGTVVALLLDTKMKERILDLEKKLAKETFAKYYTTRRLKKIVFEQVKVVY